MFVPRLTGDVISLYLSAPYLWCCNYNKLRRKLSNMHGKCGSCIYATCICRYPLWDAQILASKNKKEKQILLLSFTVREMLGGANKQGETVRFPGGNSSFRISTARARDRKAYVGVEKSCRSSLRRQKLCIHAFVIVVLETGHETSTKSQWKFQRSFSSNVVIYQQFAELIC